MIHLETMLVFIGVAAALAAVPGPDNIFVLTQSAVHGRIAGLIVTLGIALGLFVHTTAVALGVAVIFQTSQYAFSTLKYAGAAYLLYLAWQAFTASKGKFEGDKSKSETAPKQFLRGFTLCIVNPKLTIFFLAFLPQFVVPENGPVLSTRSNDGLRDSRCFRCSSDCGRFTWRMDQRYSKNSNLAQPNFWNRLCIVGRQIGDR